MHIYIPLKSDYGKKTLDKQYQIQVKGTWASELAKKYNP